MSQTNLRALERLKMRSTFLKASSRLSTWKVPLSEVMMLLVSTLICLSPRPMPAIRRHSVEYAQWIAFCDGKYNLQVNNEVRTVYLFYQVNFLLKG